MTSCRGLLPALLYRRLGSGLVWEYEFSGKDSEDNLIRVCSKEIAAELLELTFGKQEANYIIENNATVRQTAKEFGISKSTVVTQ